MDGIHDLGGKQGFGAITTSEEGPALPERWQGFVFTLVNEMLRSGIAANVDYFRHAVERVLPSAYLDDGYYGRWLGAAETILVEAGELTQDEVGARVLVRGNDLSRAAARPAVDPARFPSPDDGQPDTAERSVAEEPKFKPGDRVRTARFGARGHTRLPAYARGASGEVITLHNAWVFPDSNAHGRGEDPQHLYTVRFENHELFGEDCDPDVVVCLDLFEPYLEKEA